MGLVDWPLLILFAGLFVVNHAVSVTGVTAATFAWMAQHVVSPESPIALFGLTFVLSNVVSNVPAVMLLLPAASHAQAGAMLALVSTLAGNLLIVGSIANIIVVDAARRQGIEIDWRQHARVGVPVTLITLTIAGLWLAIR